MLAGIKYAESWLDAMQGCILLAPGSPRSLCISQVECGADMGSQEQGDMRQCEADGIMMINIAISARKRLSKQIPEPGSPPLALDNFCKSANNN